MSVVAPAVSNALHAALGVRMRRAPFTPERVWRAVWEAKAATGADRDGAADGRAGGGIPDWWTATEWTSRARRPR
jgi:hypothetical protein